MTAPAVASTTNSSASSGTTLAVATPDVSAGDYLLCHLRAGSASGGAAPAGWTALFSGGVENFYYRYFASGVAAGSTNFTQGSSAAWAAQVHLVTGAHASTPPEYSVGGSSGTNANPDAPNLTASWGAEDNLWFALYGWGHLFGTNRTYSSSPTNYTTQGTPISVTPAFAQVAIAAAIRQLNASSENPGTATLSGSIQTWASHTVVFRPAGAPPTLIPRMTLMGVG